MNFEQPWKQTPIGFDSRDDILDIAVADDLASWRIKDRDELDWSVEVGKIPAAEAAATDRVADAVISRIEARAWPFTDEAWKPLVPESTWTTPTLPESWAVVDW